MPIQITGLVKRRITDFIKSVFAKKTRSAHQNLAKSMGHLLLGKGLKSVHITDQTVLY